MYTISPEAEGRLRAIEGRVDGGGALSPRLHKKGKRMDPETPPVESDQDGADYRAGYAAGRAGCWVPVLLAWRHVRAGDVILDRQERPWVVVGSLGVKGGMQITARATGDPVKRVVDPDEQATVLMPVAEVDARRVLTAMGLKTRIVDRTVTSA